MIIIRRKFNGEKRRKRSATYIAGILSAVLFISIAAIPTGAAHQETVSIQNKTTEAIPLSLNGRNVLESEAYLIDSTTYVPLRAFCDEMGGCSISWDDASKTATVEREGLYLTATPGKKYIRVNGRYFYTVSEVLNLDGRVYVPIRPMAKAFGLELEWNSYSRSVSLESTGARTKWASEVYINDEIYWLSRIINAEAGAEPFLGKIAVGNVVLNRVRSSLYPNTIYGVIFDRKHGTQFSPVAFGTIYNTPNEESIIAAMICLEGYTLSEDILYFLNPRIATNFWIVNNCNYEFTIGRHDFYS
jgi:N-acetylmuramoyl-L-alanine amidase